MKKLYKNEHDEVLTGMIGGIGEYFDVDPTVLRIAFVVLVLITGVFPGVIAYIIAYFIIPEKPHAVSTLVTPPPMKTPEPEVASSATRRGGGVEVKPEPKAEPEVAMKEEAPQPDFGHSVVTPEEATVTVDDLMEPTPTETIDGEPVATHEVETKENSAEPKNPIV